jgi:hypothetical protein
MPVFSIIQVCNNEDASRAEMDNIERLSPLYNISINGFRVSHKNITYHKYPLYSLNWGTKKKALSDIKEFIKTLPESENNSKGKPKKKNILPKHLPDFQLLMSF